MTTDINELFSRNPLELTNENIDKIIAEMRKRRHLFKAGALTTSAPAKLTEGQEKAKTLLSSLDIKL